MKPNTKVTPSFLDYLSPVSLFGFFVFIVFNPIFWLKSSQYRKAIVYSRSLLRFYKSAKFIQDPKDAVEGTLHKNAMPKFKTEGSKRSEKLIYPLLSIDHLMKKQDSLDVLSIGPRNEAELLTLYAYGFSPQRIHAIDLFSNSPWIEVGDMHALPYKDHSFDVIFVGWVLAYSTNHAKAVSEICRVAKPGAYISIGWDAHDLEKTTSKASIDIQPITGSDDIIRLFGNYVDSVVFKGELDKRNNSVKEQIVCVLRVN